MKIYNKLVRDKVPQIIALEGKEAVTRILHEDEYLQELIKKLGEEFAEFKADISIEELADIQEVVLALADTLASREKLEEARKAKAEIRGGFKNKIFLESVE